MLSAPKPELGIFDDKQCREIMDHQSVLSVPGNETRKERKISTNHAPGETSSGSLGLSRSSTSSLQISSSVPLYSDPSTNLLRVRSAIRASRWLQQQIVEPGIGSSEDNISQGRGICGESIYTLLFDRDYQCLECGNHQDKWTRAIAHQRVHFGHKPFQCEGDCGRKSW